MAYNTLYELSTGAWEELQERTKDEVEREKLDISDHIHEVADSRVPVFYNKLLQVASSSVWLAASECEY